MADKKEQIQADKEDFKMLVSKEVDLEKALKSKETQEKIEVIATPTQTIPPIADYVFECTVTYPIPPQVNPQFLALQLQPKIDEFKSKIDILMREYNFIRL